MIDHKRLIATVNSMVHRLITVGHGWSEPLPPQKIDDLAGDAPDRDVGFQTVHQITKQ